MREVCLVLARDGAIVWSDASDSPVALADSRARWEAIWAHRHELLAIVHSHPVGPQAFSHEDVTTMDALDAALGQALTYAVVAPHGLIARGPLAASLSADAWWVRLLRLASGMAG